MPAQRPMVMGPRAMPVARISDGLAHRVSRKPGRVHGRHRNLAALVGRAGPGRGASCQAARGRVPTPSAAGSLFCRAPAQGSLRVPESAVFQILP